MGGRGGRPITIMVGLMVRMPDEALLSNAPALCCHDTTGWRIGLFLQPSALPQCFRRLG